MTTIEINTTRRSGTGEEPIGDIIRSLPFRVPAGRAGELDALAAAGRAAAAAGAVDHRVNDRVEASEETKRAQALVRRDALDKALTAKRENCRDGLSCLYEDQHALELQAWLDAPQARTLILAGRTGSGKTQAAYATAAQAARYGAACWNPRTREAEYRPLIIRAWAVNQYLRELMPDGSPEPIWSVRNRAIWAELLILDDLGAELDDVASSYMRKEIADLADARLERNLRTIVTTNHDAKTVEHRLGERLWSRLQEESTALVFRGPDRRAMKKLDW